MAQVEEVLVPDIGDFTDVPIVELLVSAGDTVAAEDSLVVIESDKATMEVPAPFGGTVGELRVAVGDTVSEGSVLLTLARENGARPAADTAPAEQADAPDAEAGAASAVASATVAEAQAEPADEPTPAPPPAGGWPTDGPVHASPVARRMAHELGVDVGAVAGSGPHGRVRKQDVQSAADGSGAPADAAPPVPAGDERVALTRIQQLSAAHTARAWQTIPHVTHHEDADITELEAFRKQLNAEQSDVKVTMVALLLKACAACLDAFPRFASSLDGDELVLRGARHLGFAADTPNGLVVPVIRDVNHKGVLALAGELGALSAKAREGKLAPKEISGAVFTISSLGGIGGTGFSPIVNLPQVAILGVVRSATRPVWDGTQFTPRLILPFSLSYDHRVIDGAAAARFCAHLAQLLGDLRRLVL